MNTKGNQRYKDTKKRIKKVLLQLLREGDTKITVQKICQRAEIHRTTFYGHYEDINSLFREMVGEMYLQMMDFFSLDKGEFDENGFLKTFELVKENRAFFLYYFKNIRAELHVDNLLPRAFRNMDDETMGKCGIKSKEELIYQQTFMSSGTIAIISRWIQNDCKESPAEMCNLMKRNYRVFFSDFTPKRAIRRSSTAKTDKIL